MQALIIFVLRWSGSHGRNDRATDPVGVCGGRDGASAGADILQVPGLPVPVADRHRHSAGRRLEPRQPDPTIPLSSGKFWNSPISARQALAPALEFSGL